MNRFNCKKGLAGACFTLYDECGRPIAKGVTDTKGELLFPALPYGRYVLRQTSAPCGYLPASGEAVVEISCAHPHEHVCVSNEWSCGSVLLQAYGVKKGR